MPSSKINKARKGVFISYARSDGEGFVNLLRERLESEQIPLWQDRVGMEGGRDWWLQITEALDRVEFMALVLTPNALASDTVRKEWRYARQEGVCVYPIKGSPDLDFDALPRWMRSAHFYDLGTIENNLEGPEWPKFVNDLKTRCQTKRVPFMVEDLPEGFVPRPDEFDQLVKLLIDERREEPVAITAALKGAGGYGKTTMAKALCHDQRIQDAFDDGILWITLGENPGDLIGCVEDLIVTLGNERPGFTTQDAAVNCLKELLADRDILIVVDDVWDRAHLNPFIQGGVHCARLVTTRNFETLPVGAARVHVDAMQQDEAIALLAVGLDRTDGLRLELMNLASRLGKWPLLLRLANSTLRSRIENDHQSLGDAVRWINKALDRRGLSYFDARNSDERHQAVLRTIGISLDLLNDKERERYGELAIFPEDVEIPLSTLEKLWATTGGLDEFDTEELCSRLNSFSLLWSYDANRKRIRLHDVVRKLLIEERQERLASIHSKLLDAHRSIPWAGMSTNEPYLWDHLAYHLVEAGCGDELVAVVKDWRYLVAKTLTRKSPSVDVDLLMAQRFRSDDELLRLLQRNLVSSAHILNRCEKKEDLEVTLFSRLQHLNELKPLTTDLAKQLKRPYVAPASRLPDLPHPALIRTLSGHSGWVRDCAVSDDGTTIVSASNDGTVKVWDGQRGTERFPLLGHAGVVNSSAVSADGVVIVSASADRTIKVWDGRSGAERFTLHGHARAVTGCAVSADGVVIVSASIDQTLKVWDVRTGKERFTLRGHTSRVNSCTVSADGSTIVSASDDETLKVWDGHSGTERCTLRGHMGAVRSCAVSADGITIVSGSTDRTLKVWNALGGTERFTLRGHDAQVRGCAISADGATIVSASEDHMLKVWDGQNAQERLMLSDHTGWVNGCAVTADGATIISASNDRTLKIWDVKTPFEPSLTKLMGPSEMRNCAVSANGTMVVSTSVEKGLKVWDTRRGAESLTLDNHPSLLTGCAINADGTTIASSSSAWALEVWDGKSGARRFSHGHRGWVNGCAVSADGATIVSASWHSLRIIDGRSGTLLFTLDGHTALVNGCAISADGITVVSASADETLRVWDARNGSERFILEGHTDGVFACAVSADGATIASISVDKTVKVWDGRRGIERFTLRGHANAVRGCALTADGATVISVSTDQTMKLWDGETGECLSTLFVDGLLYDCACSANGELVVAVGTRGIYFLRLIR